MKMSGFATPRKIGARRISIVSGIKRFDSSIIDDNLESDIVKRPKRRFPKHRAHNRRYSKMEVGKGPWLTNTRGFSSLTKTNELKGSETSS
jgi:hypothetical protein